MKKRNIISLAISAVLLTAIILTLFLHVFPVIKNRKDENEFADMMKQYYINKNAGFVTENATLGEVDVAFIGDSLTDGYDLAQYYPDMAVINRGIGGDTTHGVYDRLETSLIVPNPKVIVMMIGTNNIYDMFTDYEQILITLQEKLPDTKVVLMSIPPVGATYADRNVQIAFNNVKIKALSEKYGYTYIDIFTKLLNMETNLLRSEYSTDDLHFTPLGYSVITAEVMPVLEALLSEN